MSLTMTTLFPTALKAAAKAMAASCGEDPDDYASLLDICGPNNEPLLTWQKYEEQATAAITAYLEARKAEGWVMVPVEPTPGMIWAYIESVRLGPAGNPNRGYDGKDAWFAAHTRKCADRWRAMLAAAPSSPGCNIS